MSKRIIQKVVFGLLVWNFDLSFRRSTCGLLESCIVYQSYWHSTNYDNDERLRTSGKLILVKFLWNITLVKKFFLLIFYCSDRVETICLRQHALWRMSDGRGAFLLPGNSMLEVLLWDVLADVAYAARIGCSYSHGQEQFASSYAEKAHATFRQR